MFGNTHGWAISAAIALVMGCLLYYVAAPPARTEPTNSATLAIANKELALPVAWSSAVSAGTNECDAGDSYQKAIEDYHASQDIYEKFNHGGAMEIKESEMPAVADILNGRDCRNCNLFRKDPSKVLNYDNTEPPLDALNDVGNICSTLGKLYTNENYPHRDPARAVRLWQAAFILGAHLYDERMSWAELAAGHGLMQNASRNLLQYYKDQKNQAEVDKLQAFIDAEDGYQPKITEAFKIIGGIDESYGGKYAGDIFQIAQNAEADPIFRAEAIKHIGHYRYNALNSGDQLAARKVLRVLAEGSNLPLNVTVAAKEARELTIQQHNTVGGGS